MDKLPRLSVGWDTQPGLFPRYWDTAMTAIETDDGGTAVTNEVYISDYYPAPTSTDSDALLAFAAAFNAGLTGDVALNFAPGKGRGPSGRYIIDQEILFTQGSRLVLDLGESTLRWTTPTARIHYKAPQVTGSSSVTPVSFFVVRNGVCQYAAAIDCLFYWDFQYKDSRDMGTGYAENLRCYPQDNNNTGHTTVATFRTKNTWYWSASRVHAKGPPRAAGSYVAGNSFLRQEGLCVVANITNSCELEFYDTAIIPGIANLVGVNGTFAGGASYGRGKALQQGANIAYFGRNDNYQGNGTYALYDESGTLVNGVCNVLDSLGAITGTFTITGISRFGQVSEAISVSGGSTIITGNYIINATSPSPANKFLEWNFEDMHCALYKGAVKVDGISALSFGSGMFTALMAPGTTLLDVNNGDNVHVSGLQFTSSDLSNVTVFKGRNITAGHVSNNTVYFAKYLVDLDNTVKSFKVHGNSAYELTTVNNPTITTFLNTGLRYNGTNTRGIDFKSNGRMGKGFDTDDNHILDWFPVPTAANGQTISYTLATGGAINVNNGVLTLNAKFNITAINGAGVSGANALRISFPASSLLSEFGVPTTALSDFIVTCRIGNVPVAALYDSVNSRIVVTDADPFNNTPPGTGNGFRINNNPVGVPYAVFVQASVPIEYD